MPIKNWPQADRPREKLLTKGEQHLTDTELIAICLRAGVRGKSALDIAKELLTTYGSLKKLLSTPPTELMQHAGIGKARYATLRAAIELGRRYAANQLVVGSTITSTQFAHTFLAERMREYTSEVFACLFLDNRLRVTHFEELFHGTINETRVYPREIIRHALLHHAANIILVHNHPSGQQDPSAADQQLTMMLKQALAYVDIKLVDHLIIAHQGYFSFAEHGII